MKRTLVISVLATLLLDQASKWFMLCWLLDPAIRVPVLPFLDFVLAWNRGISFGIFGDGGIPPWGLLVVAILIAGWLAWMGLNADSRWGAVSYGLIVGGALGNAIDRAIHGAVVDFIFFHLDGFSWPVFNLADSAITVGVVMILIETLFFARPDPK